MKVSISAAWDESKAVLARHRSPLTAVALALLVLPGTILGTISPEASQGLAPAEGSVAAVMLAVLLIGLVARLTIARIALGTTATVKETMGQALRRAPAVMVAILLFLLPVALLLAPFMGQFMEDPTNPPSGAVLAATGIMILALLLGVRLLSMVIPAAAAERLGPIALMKRSWRLTAGNWWRLFGFIFLYIVAASIAGWAAAKVLGSILAIISGRIEAMSISALLIAAVLASIGAVFTVVFATMLARIYAQLTGPGEAQASVPTTGT